MSYARTLPPGAFNQIRRPLRQGANGIYVAPDRGQTTTSAMTLDRVIYVPYDLPNGIGQYRLQEIAVELTVANGVGGVVRIGCYTTGANDRPNQLLCESAPIAADVLGVKTLSAINDQLIVTYPRIWFAFVAQVAVGGTIRKATAGLRTPNQGTFALALSQAQYAYTQDGVAGALPAIANSADDSANETPVLFAFRLGLV